MEKPQFITSVSNHLREKAPAYALTAVVALGSLALIGENDGENPSVENSIQQTVTPRDHEELCQELELEAHEPVKGC